MKTILLVSHVSDRPGGPIDKFYSYLKNRYNIYRILYPINPNEHQKSVVIGSKQSFYFTLPSLLQYLLEGPYALIIWYIHFRNAPKIDLAICFDSLSYLHTYFGKFIFHIDKIVYYNVDYSKKRFSNPVLNKIYTLITKFSYISCNYFFSFDNAFIKGVDPKGEYTYKHAIVTSIVDLMSIKKNTKKISCSLVYAGTIGYGTIDFEPLLKALKQLKDEKIVFQLYIYCNKSDEKNLTSRITFYNLKEQIIFCGMVENDILVQRMLPRYAIGIAPYAKKLQPNTPDFIFMNNNLTGKLVDYIAAGLPIISTKINDAFGMIDDNKIGYSVSTPEEWHDALKNLLYNKELYKKYSMNAARFAKNYDADIVLKPIFKKIFE